VVGVNVRDPSEKSSTPSPHSWRAAWLLTLVALLVRLPLLTIGIARDEGSTYFNAVSVDLAQTVAACELNPPGYFFLTRWFLQCFGTSEWTLKMPAFVCGVLLVPATYGLGRLLATPRVALLAAFLIAFSPEGIYFAQEARPYTLASLLLCLCVGAFWTRSALVLAVAGAVFLYVQYTGFALLGALCLAGSLRPPRLWTWLVVAGSLLLFFPWWPTFLAHLSTGVPWAVPVPPAERVGTLLHALMKVVPLAPGVGYAALLVGVGLAWKRHLPGEHPRTLLVTLVVFVGGLSALAMADNYVLPAQPLVALGLALVFDPRPRWRQALLAVSLVGGLVYVGYHTRVEKSGVRSTTPSIAAQPRTLVVVSPDYLGPTAGFYLRDHGVALRGFARWQQPELFRPGDYAELWSRPDLLETWMASLAREASAYEHLALLSESEPLQDSGRMRYSRAEGLRERLARRYPLMHSTQFPAQQEPVRLDLYKVSLAGSLGEARNQGRTVR
jgi:hypothetical protein